MTRSTQALEGSPGSRVLHRLKSLSATTSASMVAATLSFALLGWALVSGSRTEILSWFEAAAAAITVTMVFVLQHTQARQELALQRKLDEILRALPGADDRLISLEAAPEKALEAEERRFADIRSKTASS